MRLCHPLWEGRRCIYPSAFFEGFFIAFSCDGDDIFLCFGSECDTVYGYQSTASSDITLDRSSSRNPGMLTGSKIRKHHTDFPSRVMRKNSWMFDWISSRVSSFSSQGSVSDLSFTISEVKYSVSISEDWAISRCWGKLSPRCRVSVPYNKKNKK